MTHAPVSGRPDLRLLLEKYIPGNTLLVIPGGTSAAGIQSTETGVYAHARQRTRNVLTGLLRKNLYPVLELKVKH